MALQVAPEVEAAAGRRFVHHPTVTIDDAATIVSTIGADKPADSEAEAELQAVARRLVAQSVAVYYRGLTTIFVNTDVARDWLRTLEAEGESAAVHVRCALAHELTHALQHQYGTVGADPRAEQLLAEGHATWVALKVCGGAPLAAQRNDAQMHLLQAPTLDADARPYVVGEAAVSTLIEGLGVEAYWAAVGSGQLSADEMDGLADGRRHPGWQPERFGEGAAFAARWGESRLEYHDSWELGRFLVGRWLWGEVRGGGLAIRRDWTVNGYPVVALAMRFPTEADAGRVLRARKTSLADGQVDLLWPLGWYRNLQVRRSLRRRDVPAGSTAGLTLSFETDEGARYREVWSQQGAELRVVLADGDLPANTLGAALKEWAELPGPAPTLGPAAPRAKVVIDRVAALPPASPEHVAAGFVADRLAIAEETTGDCVGEYRAWAAAVSDADRGELVGIAAHCAIQSGQVANLAELQVGAGTDERWDEANLLFAEAAARAQDWPAALAHAERVVGVGSVEVRRDRVLVAAWLALGRLDDLRTFASDPLNEDRLRYRAVSELWRQGDKVPATLALPTVCRSTSIPFCQGDWRARLRGWPRGTAFPP